jgi:hypothetical protein
MKLSQGLFAAVAAIVLFLYGLQNDKGVVIHLTGVGCQRG